MPVPLDPSLFGARVPQSLSFISLQLTEMRALGRKGRLNRNLAHPIDTYCKPETHNNAQLIRSCWLLQLCLHPLFDRRLGIRQSSLAMHHHLPTSWCHPASSSWSHFYTQLCQFVLVSNSLGFQWTCFPWIEYVVKSSLNVSRNVEEWVI